MNLLPTSQAIAIGSQRNNQEKNLHQCGCDLHLYQLSLNNKSADISVSVQVDCYP